MVRLSWRFLMRRFLSFLLFQKLHKYGLDAWALLFLFGFVWIIEESTYLMILMFGAWPFIVINDWFDSTLGFWNIVWFFACILVFDMKLSQWKGDFEFFLKIWYFREGTNRFQLICLAWIQDKILRFFLDVTAWSFVDSSLFVFFIFDRIFFLEMNCLDFHLIH